MNDETQDKAEAKAALVQFQPPRLPYHEAINDRFGIDRSGWKTLTDAIFPNANSADSIALALSYCRARNLDVFKRPVHIVPMWDSNRRCHVETIWPGISELRTTAFRTGQYAGCDEAEFGPEEEHSFTGKVKDNTVTIKLKFPAWCRMTVYRDLGGRTCKFVGPKVYWLEAYATVGRSDLPNDMWRSRPSGQIEKCAESAALRKAFPEELGNILTAEEMHGRVITTDTPHQPERQSVNLLERLPGRMAGDGFGPNVVNNGLLDKEPEGEPKKPRGKGKAKAAPEVAQETKPTGEAPATVGAILDEATAQDHNREPETSEEYEVYAEYWISVATDIDEAQSRFEGESELRDRLKMPIKNRSELRKLLDEKCEAIVAGEMRE